MTDSYPETQPINVPDYMSLNTNEELLQRVKELESKVDNLTQGLTATYQGVQFLVQMLQGVQVAAQSMGGFGGSIMRKMVSGMNGGNPDGE